MKTRSLILSLVVLFNSSLAFGQNDNYKDDWNKVDSIDALGLPKTALEMVEGIYNKAIAEKNTPQLIKAVIYKMKYNSMIEDDAFVKNIESAEKLCSEAQFAVKPILHSMLAEMYWWYFQNNRYTFYNRCITNDFIPDDIRTWDLNKIVSTSIAHYKASIENSDKLKLIRIGYYKEILTHCNLNEKIIRPTLYDFLVHRAIDFFINDEAGLTHPINEFNISNENYFLPAGSFLKLTILTEDTLNFKYNAIKLFQDVMRFHLNDILPEAFTDVDLQRVDFVYKNSASPIKDSLYLNSLNSIRKNCFGSELANEVDMQIAQKLYDIGNTYNPKVSEQHKWDKKKAYDFCLQNKKDFNSQNLLNTIEQQEIKLTIEKENLPNEPFRALVQFKNTDTVFFRAIKTTYKELEDIKNAYNDSINDNKNKDKNKKHHAYVDQNVFVIDYLKRKKPFVQFQDALPDDEDFQEHSAEVKIPALEKGLYFIMAGTDTSMDYKKNTVNFGLTAITGISYISRKNSDGSNDFYVLDRKTGAPLSGVKAECWEIKYNKSTRNQESNLTNTFISDAEGFISIPNFSDNDNGSYGIRFYLNFIYNNDDFWSTNNIDIWRNDASFSNNPDYNNHSFQIKTFFFTDRNIYRPGQNHLF